MDQSQVVINAYQMKNTGYKYVFGANGQIMTLAMINDLINIYPSHFNTEARKTAARSKAGYHCVDCSSFCLLAMGIDPTVNDKDSATLFSESPQNWLLSERRYMQHGMFVYRPGHIGMLNETGLGDNSLIIEAYDEFEDIKEVTLAVGMTRSNPFQYFGKFAGVAYAIGYLDVVNSSQISGWAWDGVNDAVITITIQVIRNATQQLVYTNVVSANAYRPDLAAAGIGNGYHAFNCNLNMSSYPSGTYTVYTFMNFSGGPQLFNSPWNITI